MNIESRDTIPEIVAKCTAKKPYRAAIVAKTVKIKQVLSEIKVALNEREVSFWHVNIAPLTYIFRVQNGSVIEVVDKSVYKGESHVFHGVASEGDGFRLYPLKREITEGL